MINKYALRLMICKILYGKRSLMFYQQCEKMEYKSPKAYSYSKKLKYRSCLNQRIMDFIHLFVEHVNAYDGPENEFELEFNGYRFHDECERNVSRRQMMKYLNIETLNNTVIKAIGINIVVMNLKTKRCFVFIDKCLQLVIDYIPLDVEKPECYVNELLKDKRLSLTTTDKNQLWKNNHGEYIVFLSLAFSHYLLYGSDHLLSFFNQYMHTDKQVNIND